MFVFMKVYNNINSYDETLYCEIYTFKNNLPFSALKQGSWQRKTMMALQTHIYIDTLENEVSFTI